MENKLDYENLGSLISHFPSIKLSQEMPIVTFKEKLNEKNVHK